MPCSRMRTKKRKFLQKVYGNARIVVSADGFETETLSADEENFELEAELTKIPDSSSSDSSSSIDSSSSSGSSSDSSSSSGEDQKTGCIGSLEGETGALLFAFAVSLALLATAKKKRV